MIMANITTKFLGLELKSPIIVSSSGLTKSVDNLKKIEKQGAGAVVLKSMFEEQIHIEAGHLLNESNDYPEAEDYIRAYAKHNTVDEYLKLIKDGKNAINIPIIANINCTSADDWTDFAIKIEQAGADALVLNINILPNNADEKSSEFEKRYLDIAEKVMSKINIPLVVKLGPNFTNILHLSQQLQFRGVKGIVLFNRFYQPDIDIDKMEITAAPIFSQATDIRYSLRWVGMVSGIVNDIEIFASTGNHSSSAIIKQLLAGAQTAGVCSILYKKGVEYIKTMNDELSKWMDKHEYKNIEEFRGKLSYDNIKDPQIYERSQFMKYYSSVE
jgi:dihydroorotate dehydrogenase (fumarate)